MEARDLSLNLVVKTTGDFHVYVGGIAQILEKGAVIEYLEESPLIASAYRRFKVWTGTLKHEATHSKKEIRDREVKEPVIVMVHVRDNAKYMEPA